MFETYTTVMGRIITEPRRTATNLHGEVLNFRMASYSRRRNRETGEWHDGPVLYLTVTCWRKLAVTADQALFKGASIIAHGQLRTNEYQAGDGSKRSDLEMTATSIGLDLAQVRQEEPAAPAPQESADPWGDRPASEEDGQTDQGEDARTAEPVELVQA